MRLSLDPHQVKTVDYMLDNPYSICALEMGLGKSACALKVWEHIGGTCLIICPSYLVLNWRDEIRKCLGDSPIITVIRKGKDIPEFLDADFCIVSYDLAQKAEHFFEWASMVVLDEGQEIKSMKAKRTEFLHRVVYENSIKRLHILTGTPISNRVEEYYSLMALMSYDPRIKESEFLRAFPDSITFADYFSHRREYTMKARGRFIPIVKWEGVQRPQELKRYLKGRYIRFKSEDVLVLEPLRFKDILISETPDKKLLEAFETWTNNKENEGVSPTLKAEAALETVPFTVQYVKKLLEEVESVVIYSDHRESCKAIAKAFNVPAITGEMPTATRHRLGVEFQAGKSRVISATIRSFSTGVNLTRAKNMVINDLPWVPGHLRQTYFRIQRRDQTKACTIHRILGSPQSQAILRALESKLETIDKVT